jgi:hypothetical protein
VAIPVYLAGIIQRTAKIGVGTKKNLTKGHRKTYKTGINKRVAIYWRWQYKAKVAISNPSRQQSLCGRPESPLLPKNRL